MVKFAAKKHLVKIDLHNNQKQMKVLIAAILFATLFVGKTQAQNTAQKTLEANMGTMEELSTKLTTDFNSITDMSMVLPKGIFAIGKIFCVSPYGDAGALAQTKQIETDLKSALGESKWSFGPNTYDRPEFGVMGKLQIAAKSKTETLNYSSSGALFKPEGLFEGMDIQIAVYQNKKNPKLFTFLFPVSTTCSAVLEVTKQ